MTLFVVAVMILLVVMMKQDLKQEEGEYLLANKKAPKVEVVLEVPLDSAATETVAIGGTIQEMGPDLSKTIEIITAEQDSFVHWMDDLAQPEPNQEFVEELVSINDDFDSDTAIDDGAGVSNDPDEQNILFSALRSEQNKEGPPDDDKPSDDETPPEDDSDTDDLTDWIAQ